MSDTTPSTRARADRKVWFRRLTTGLALSFLALCGLVVLLVPPVGARPANAPYQALGTSVVISEFRTTGPSGENDEFVEIFNPTQNQIEISGWKVMMSPSAGGAPIDQYASFPANTWIQPGQYILIASSLYSGSVTADYVFTTGVGIEDNGGIAITRADNSVIDQVGMSAATVYGEGTRLGQLTGTQNRSYVRNPNGTGGVCHDNNNNATDFVVLNPSNPQNSSSPFTPCPAPTATPELPQRIIINEVAWGGTQADDTLAQWIELYNPGAAVNLTGWYIRIPGKADIALSGTLPANGYYLIERNEGDTNAPANLVVAFPFLNPAGDSLLLYAPGGIVDSANANGGPWPAGSRFFSYTSMERSGPPYGEDTDSAWLNFFGTPYALDRLGNLINGSPGGPNSVGATSTPTLTPTPTSTATVTPTRTVTPTPGISMEIIISEVAWMGTSSTRTEDQWIELYNPGTTDIDLAGWTIRDGGTNVLFTFINCSNPPQPRSNCIIRAQDFLILVKNQGSITNATGDALEDQRFTFTMNTTSGTLRLFRPGGSQPVDTANRNGGVWPAGRASSSNASEAYCTMERNSLTRQEDDTTWFTYASANRPERNRDSSPICGSPGRRNWALNVTATPVPARTATLTRTPTPNRATPEPVVINEFLPHARADYNGDGVIDSGDQFIELINLGSAAVTLNNYRLDDQQGDSNPYTITGVTLQPGTRIAFFSSETGILLSNGGDSVRLFKPNGLIADAFTYGVLKELDRSWCRYPDGKFTVAGQSNWTFGCQPSPDKPNELATTERIGMEELPLICRSPRLPFGIYLSECDRLGLWNWNSAEPLPLLLPFWLEADGTLFIFE